MLFKGWVQNSDPNMKEIIQNHHTTLTSSGISMEIPSPRPLRKLHPFKSIPKKSIHHQSGTPPESPTLPGRKFK